MWYSPILVGYVRVVIIIRFRKEDIDPAPAATVTPLQGIG